MSSLFGGGTTQTQQTTNTNQTQNQSGQSQQTNTGNTTQNNTGNTSQQNNSGPGSLALPYITGALQDANGIFNSQNGTPYYPGEIYAGLNPTEQSALTGLDSFANGTGSQIAGSLTSAGNGAIGNLAQGGAVANAVAQQALGNPTQYNITNAGQYANNPYTQGILSSINQPIQNNLEENTLPALNMAAVGSGNNDSSRAAIESAIDKNFATQDETNADASFLGNQYANGLNLSQTGLGQGMMFGNASAGTLANIGQAGASDLGAGYTTNVNNDNIPLQSGEILQQDQQNQDNANLQRYQGNEQQPWSLLSPYWNMISSGILGQSQTGNQSTTQTGTQNSNQTANATSSSNGTSQGTSQSNGTIQQPGPGLVGGLLGAATGIGSLFSSGGLLSGGLGSLFGSGGGTGGLYVPGTSNSLFTSSPVTTFQW